MIRTLRRVAVPLAIALVAVGAGLLASFHRAGSALFPRPPADRPPLMLLSSLPLLFNEDFSLNNGGSPAVTRLQTRYRVIPISVTNRQELANARLLLMAQPQAQAAENLVVLDEWVRGGGRLLLFADPMLEWPSKRPLGDMLRPPVVFTETGLLAHWGLSLDPPNRSGPATRELAGITVETASPGSLSGTCGLSKDRFIAHCRIGKGEVIVVADADVLDTAQLGAAANHNLDAALNELASLEHP